MGEAVVDGRLAPPPTPKNLSRGCLGKDRSTCLFNST